MKITIVTPIYNAENYIKDTILSIIDQCNESLGDTYVEHIICDGNSTDKSLEIIKETICIKNKRYLPVIISEKDTGMYDALSKGLNKSTGDVISYLNAGDLYEKNCFIKIMQAFKKSNVKWVTGRRVLIDESNSEIKNNLPYRYRNELILSGFYGRKVLGFLKLPYIQQESTFWKRELTSYIDFKELANLKLAGDYYIWTCFAKNKNKLNIINENLGKFKIHNNQLSSNKEKYENEVLNISDSPNVSNILKALFDLPVWLIKYKYKKFKTV